MRGARSGLFLYALAGLGWRGGRGMVGEGGGGGRRIDGGSSSRIIRGTFGS